MRTRINHYSKFSQSQHDCASIPVLSKHRTTGKYTDMENPENLKARGRRGFLLAPEDVEKRRKKARLQGRRGRNGCSKEDVSVLKNTSKSRTGGAARIPAQDIRSKKGRERNSRRASELSSRAGERKKSHRRASSNERRKKKWAGKKIAVRREVDLA